MADQNDRGRPPRNAAKNVDPLAWSHQSATDAPQPTSSSNSNAAKCSSSTETPSRQPSFHSLEPYDERNLHDADHSPRRSLVDTSCAAAPAPAAEAVPPLGQSDISIPSMNNAIGNGSRHATTHGQIGAHIAPFPAPNTGHRRRKIGGATSSEEHRSARPNRNYAYHHQRGNQYEQQYNQSAQQSSFSHGHAPTHATTRRRTVRSTNRRTVAAGTAPVAYAALPETAAPSLRPVLAALWRALLLAILSKSKSIIQYCTSVTGKALARKWVRFILYFIGGVVAVFVACIATAAYGFYQEAKELCTPPSEDFVTLHPPLVEYFVHGRGNGHYARSVAIIEKLNDAGIDVRMFIGRATMWRAVHEAHISGGSNDGRQRYEEKVGGYEKTKGGKLRRGVTTAISVTSITPAMDVFATISHILERVTGDCEVARQTGRYPALVVTDGDIPGMLRSFFGSIPSVGISHGQTFSVGIKPSFVKSNKRLNAAWENQSSLNWRAAFLTNWQIGTSFASMETRRPTGVIARSPMRPEAVGMARERWRRRHIGSRKDVLSSSGDGRNVSSSVVETAASLATGTAHRFLSPEQRSKIDSLLLGGAKGRTVAPKNQSRLHRKLVICYFRDKNGDVLQNALLRSGFDVLLFERGYHKGLMNIQGVEKFGHKWIINRDAKADEEMADMELEDYWRKMLAGTDAKLLEDDAGQQNATVLTTTSATSEQWQDNDTADAVPSDEPRIIRVTDMSLFIPLLSIADGVASSAGSQLISECIYSGTPILSLYRGNDDEQMLNIMIYRNLIANDKEKDPTGVGKVVHGISLEEFAEAFSFLTVDDAAAQRRGHKGSTKSRPESDEVSPKLLTKEQEFLLLRKPEARRAYDEFDQFVDTIVRSKVSSTYYDEVIQGDDPRDASGWQDPFQGMADAAPVMLEILKEITGKE
mmetsp:Transcript_24076/g.52420  ORF Transcript_24076/g.52420 Transcript_24076/m.52420 type:complete len:927 (-) Transcript_24076:16-2796(-)